MATEIQGRVGPIQASDGTIIDPRLTKDGAVLVQEGNGRYYELAYRQQLFVASTAIAGVAVVAANASPLAPGTGVPLVGIFNPVGSKVNLVVIKVRVWTVSGTPAGPAAWNVIPANAGITAAGVQGLAAATFVAGGIGRAYVNVALTGSAQAVMLRAIGGPAAVAVGAGNYTVEEVTDGGIVIPPGAFAGVALTGAGTTHVAGASVTWAELPI